MKPRRKSGAAWLLQHALGFKPNPAPLHQGILAGGGWAFGGVWYFPDRFFFPMGKILA